MCYGIQEMRACVHASMCAYKYFVDNRISMCSTISLSLSSCVHRNFSFHRSWCAFLALFFLAAEPSSEHANERKKERQRAVPSQTDRTDQIPIYITKQTIIYYYYVLNFDTCTLAHTHTHSAYWLIHTHIGCSVCQLCDDKNQFYQVRVIVSQTNKQTHTHIHIANSSQLRCSRRHLPPPPQWFQSIWTKCAPMKSKPTARHSHICQQKPYVSRKNNNSVWTW